MNPASRRLGLILLGFSIPMAASGCIRAEKNTVILKFDESSDRVEVLLVHEGLFTQNLDLPTDEQKKKAIRESNLKQAKAELAEFARADRTIWLFAGLFNAIPLGEDPQDSKEVAEHKRALIRLLDIKPGRFFLDERDALGAFQAVTVKDSQAVAKVVNAMFSDHIKQAEAETRDSPDPILSEESHRLLLKAAREGHDWFRISKGKIAFHLPMIRQDAEKYAADAENNEYSRAYLAIFRKSGPPLEIKAADDGLRVTLGDGASRILKFPLMIEPGPRASSRELLEIARTLPDALEPMQTTKALIERRAVIDRFETAP